MKTEIEIKAEIARLDMLRLNAIGERDNAKTEIERNVAHMMVVVYVMQSEKLQWVLSES